MPPHKLLLLHLPLLAVAAIAADTAKLRTEHSQPSFIVSTKQVEVAITQTGAHMAPVTFFRDSGQPIRPYYISPWQDEKPAKMPAPVPHHSARRFLLSALRWQQRGSRRGKASAARGDRGL
jgi:hypothetical protein